MPRKFSQLKSSRNEIRLLTVLPRSSHPGEEDEIFCEIHRSKLVDVNGDYNALSYTWGKNVADLPLNVVVYKSSKKFELEFTVQENLYQALSHIRRENESVVLWADAICINQPDDEERTAQIQQMRQVYEMAMEVVVWLGLAADGSDTVIRGMKRVVAELETKGQSVAAKGLLGGLVSIEGVSNFLARPWWSRVWVIQEIKVARKVKFLCGDEYIDGSTLSTFLKLFYKLRRRSFSLPSLSDSKKRLQLAGKDPRPRLLLSHLIWNTQQCERQWSLLRWLSDACARNIEDASQRMGAKCPEDFVLALLGLCTISESRAELTWGCKMGCSGIYIRAAELMLKDNRMAVLSYAQTPKQISGLPSWVPDWSSPILLPLTMWNVAGSRSFCASGEESGSLKPLNITGERTCLALSCRKLDCVQSMRDVQIDYKDLRALYPLVTTVANLMRQRKNRYEAKELRMFSALRCISCDLEISTSSKTRVIQRLPKDVVENVWEILNRANWHSEDGTPSKRATWYEEGVGPTHKKVLRKFLEGLCDISSDKVPFITCNGWLGMGPRCLKEGDLVMVVKGADVPYLMRRNDDGQYRLVGEAYVHGIMDGEILEMDIAESEIDLY